MDRFIVCVQNLEKGDWLTLKSNMDRFIELRTWKMRLSVIAFKIQYG